MFLEVATEAAFFSLQRLPEVAVWLLSEVQNIGGKESDRKSWSTKIMYRYTVKTNVSNDNA